MRSAALTLLGTLDDQQRALAARPFTDDAARRWLEYRPRRRPGACIAQMSVPARKAAHRLLSTGLSEHAYAQAMVIIALEEVLDRREGWRRGRCERARPPGAGRPGPDGDNGPAAVAASRMRIG